LGDEISRRIAGAGARVRFADRRNRVIVNDDVTIGFSAIRGNARFGKSHRWNIHRFKEPWPWARVAAWNGASVPC
jgi:hypothetical protein